jgi:predicted AAA+ superfamily ATPase
MYNRDQQSTVYRLASKFQVVGIMGPRQSGKTTLAKICFPHLPYVSFENFDTKMLATNDPRGFLIRYTEGCIFDEIQHVPQLLSYMQELVDADDRPGRFIVTGSQNFVLSSQLSQSLAGRMALVTLLPLSYKELGFAMTWPEAVIKGGYPRLHKYEIAPFDYYSAYLHTYIEQDVRQLQYIENLLLFKNFLQLCAGRAGQLLNVANLAKDASISHSTAQRWLSLLEASYIIFLLPSYHDNLNTRIAKQPKLYFYDTGLLCTLLGLTSEGQVTTYYNHGALFENFIILEILKHRLNQGKRAALSFWHDRVTRYEVDLIAEWDGQVHGFEIKSGYTFHQDWLKGIVALQAMKPQLHTYLVYAGPMESIYKGCSIISFDHIVRFLELLACKSGTASLPVNASAR